MTTIELIEKFHDCLDTQDSNVFPQEIVEEIVKRLGKYDRLINFLKDNNYCKEG